MPLWSETPLIFSNLLSQKLEANVYLKLEVILDTLGKATKLTILSIVRISTLPNLLNTVESRSSQRGQKRAAVTMYTLSSLLAATRDWQWRAPPDNSVSNAQYSFQLE